MNLLLKMLTISLVVSIGSNGFCGKRKIVAVDGAESSQNKRAYNSHLSNPLANLPEDLTQQIAAYLEAADIVKLSQGNCLLSHGSISIGDSLVHFKPKRTITDAQLGAMARFCCKLQKINTVNCHNLSDTGVIELAGRCPNLTAVLIRHCNITDAAVEALLKHCPSLRELRLQECAQLTDQSLTSLVQHGAALETVDLLGCLQFTNARMLSLVGCRNLQRLCFGMWFTDPNSMMRDMRLNLESSLRAVFRERYGRYLMVNKAQYVKVSRENSKLRLEFKEDDGSFKVVNREIAS